MKSRHSLETITTIQDLPKILINSSIEITTTSEFIETLTTVKDIPEISIGSNTKTATIPESEEISEISPKHYTL